MPLPQPITAAALVERLSAQVSGRSGGPLAPTTSVAPPPIGASRAPHALRAPLLVALDGCGGAGKTTLASDLATALRERGVRAEVIAVDDFTHSGVTTWDHEAFRLEVIAPALTGRAFTYRVWRWDTAEPVGTRTVPACEVLLVEGVSASATSARVPWDVTVWVEASERVRLRRVSARDGEELAAVWSEQWWPSEEKYLADDDPRVRVDFVIDCDGDATFSPAQPSC